MDGEFEALGMVLGFCFVAVVCRWVFTDAISRGLSSSSALLWSFAQLVCMFLFLPLYLMSRPGAKGLEMGMRVCPKCHLVLPAKDGFCKSCGQGMGPTPI